MLLNPCYRFKVDGGICLRKLQHSFGHSAYDQVILEPFKNAAMKRPHQIDIGIANDPRKPFFFACHQKLAQAQGIEPSEIHLANGKRGSSMDGDSEGRSCGDHRVFRRVLAKIFERCERTRHLLHLVDHDERALGLDSNARFKGKRRNKPIGSYVAVEEGRHTLIVFERDIRQRIEMAPPEFLDQPCFTHLPRTLENKRFPSRRVFPLGQPLHIQALHWASLRMGKKTPLNSNTFSEELFWLTCTFS